MIGIHHGLHQAPEGIRCKADAKQAYEESAHDVNQLTGGGSEIWSPDNFFMVFSLEQLGLALQEVLPSPQAS